MATSFINLTNQLLRRLNEVEVKVVEFTGCRGVQALAKDAIRNSIAQINAAEYEWPFNSAEHTQTLNVGQEEYSWPQYFKTADFESFIVAKNPLLGNTTSKLKFISRDVYYDNHRTDDLDADNSEGLGLPTLVAPAHGNGYIVSPTPDKPYVIQYRYYLNYADLQLNTDSTRIPTPYDYVIIEGALSQMHLFRNNNEAASIALQLFQEGIKNMQGILINQYQTVTDTRTLRVVRAYF